MRGVAVVIAMYSKCRLHKSPSLSVQFLDIAFMFEQGLHLGYGHLI